VNDVVAAERAADLIAQLAVWLKNQVVIDRSSATKVAAQPTSKKKKKTFGVSQLPSREFLRRAHPERCVRAA